MANAPQHTFGQIIGNLIEEALYPSLKKVAKEFHLYLDRKSPRTARGGKSNVVWLDGLGNKHGLDYVLEHGGSDKVIGRPRAFIEVAWRRYTKHSKNKAQEIEGAVGHLRTHYGDSQPFVGVVLAGEFTLPALAQLRSHNFTILFLPYASVMKAFKAAGIDASFDQSTSGDEVSEKIQMYRGLALKQKERIASKIRSLHAQEIAEFIESLRSSLKNTVELVIVMPLFGTGYELPTIDEAIRFIERCDDTVPTGEFVHYIVIVRYTGGDKVEGKYSDKKQAIAFLRRMF